MKFTPLILVLMMACPSVSYAQTQDLDSLTRAEAEARAKDAELAKAEKDARADLSRLRKQLRKAGTDMRALEAQTETLSQEEAALTTQFTDVQNRITTNQDTLVELLATLQRMEMNPPPALALTPTSAIEAARAGGMMQTLSETLRETTDALTLDLELLDQTREKLSEQRENLTKSRQRVEAQRADISRLVSAKSAAQAKISADRKATQAEIARLAEESKTLRELIDRLAAEAATVTPRIKPDAPRGTPKPLDLPKGTRAFSRAKGTLQRPVPGRVIRKFGRGEKGLTLAGPSGGQVVSPYTGRVEFSGPFKNYDQVVILNVGDGYFLLLTGLDAVFAQTGDVVEIGEPVGRLRRATSREAELYLELRRDGSTIDPAPWLQAQ